MPVAALFAILAGALAIAILYPHLRLIAGVVILAFGGAVTFYLATSYGPWREEVPRISLEALSLSPLNLRAERGFYVLSGRITNTSDHDLADFTLRLRLLDCPSETSPDDACAIIGEAEGIARVSVPPKQTRAFESVQSTGPVPVAEGILRPSWEILRATPRRI